MPGNVSERDQATRCAPSAPLTSWTRKLSASLPNRRVRTLTGTVTTPPDDECAFPRTRSLVAVAVRSASAYAAANASALSER